MSVLKAENLTKKVTSPEGMLTIVDDVSLDIAAAETVAIVGASGAGKSTLLRCINRLTVPDAGEVWINGRPVPADRKRLRATRREAAMIFQDHNLVPRLSVLKNVLTGRLAYMPAWQSILQIFSMRDVELAMQCLRRVELEERAWSRAERLSGGQQQRVGVARALAQQPRAILADEPVASLDPKSARVVLSDLRRAAREPRHTSGSRRLSWLPDSASCSACKACRCPARRPSPPKTRSTSWPCFPSACWVPSCCAATERPVWLGR
jgi:phosphonate transport system ATP-binding protein